MLKEAGEVMDRGVATTVMYVQQHQDPIMYAVIMILLVLMFLIVLRALRAVPQTWGSFVDRLENGWRSVIDWPKRRKMRRDKKNQLDNEYAAALEEVLEKQIEDGKIDLATAQKKRHLFGKVLPKMKPKRDVKAGVKARLARLKQEAAPVIPGAPEVTEPPGRMTQVLQFVSRRKVKTA